MSSLTAQFDKLARACVEQDAGLSRAQTYRLLALGDALLCQPQLPDAERELIGEILARCRDYLPYIPQDPK